MLGWPPGRSARLGWLSHLQVLVDDGDGRLEPVLKLEKGVRLQLLAGQAVCYGVGAKEVRCRGHGRDPAKRGRHYAEQPLAVWISGTAGAVA